MEHSQRSLEIPSRNGPSRVSTIWADRLPPVRDQAALLTELLLVPGALREDALQEAWVAHLEGGSAARAVARFNMREYRHRQQEITGTLN